MSTTGNGGIEFPPEFAETLQELSQVLADWDRRNRPLSEDCMSRALDTVENSKTRVDEQIVRTDVSQLIPKLTDEEFAKLLATMARVGEDWALISADVACQLSELVLALHERTSRPPYIEIVEQLEQGLDRSEPFAVFEALETAASEAIRITRLVQSAEKAIERLDSVRFPYPEDSAEAVRETVGSALENSDPSTLKSINDRLEAEWSQADLHQFDGESFETVVAELYESRGYRTKLTTRSNDFGIDVQATKSRTTKFIQCKLFRTKKVSGPEVGEYIAMHLLFDVDEVVIVTSSKFTEPAHVRRGLVDRPLRYINGDELCRHLTRSPLVPPVAPNVT